MTGFGVGEMTGVGVGDMTGVLPPVRESNALFTLILP